MLRFLYSSAKTTLMTLLQDIKNCMVRIRTTKHNKLKQFPVCAKVGLFFSLGILLQACEKHIQTRLSNTPDVVNR